MGRLQNLKYGKYLIKDFKKSGKFKTREYRYMGIALIQKNKHHYILRGYFYCFAKNLDDFKQKLKNDKIRFSKHKYY